MVHNLNLGKYRLLVIGSSSLSGSKLIEFLKNKGCIVYGVDLFTLNSPNSSHVLKIDLRNRNNIPLLMRISQPDIIVFCHSLDEDSFNFVDYSYQIYYNLLSALVDFHELYWNNPDRKIVLCINKIGQSPTSPAEVNQLGMFRLTEIYTKKFNWKSFVLTNKNNLLKSVKRIIMDKEVL